MSLTLANSLSPVSLTPLINIHSGLSLRIFEKSRNDPNEILRGPGDTYSWKKNFSRKSRVRLPLRQDPTFFTNAYNFCNFNFEKSPFYIWLATNFLWKANSFKICAEVLLCTLTICHLLVGLALGSGSKMPLKVGSGSLVENHVGSTTLEIFRMWNLTFISLNDDFENYTRSIVSSAQKWSGSFLNASLNGLPY